MIDKSYSKNSLEILEARIAPAAVAGPLLPTTDDKFVSASFNGAVEVHQGEVLNTTGNANSGTYFLYMEKGNALVFFTDFNNNRQVDFNELTGISVGDGARIVIFSDVHGDIVTNLRETTTTVLGSNGLPKTVVDLSLSDSDNLSSNDAIGGGDGRVLLNNSIEKIELRTLRTTDIPNQNPSVDGEVNDLDVALRQGPTTFSIFGNIYAGKSFGTPDGGLILDNSSSPGNFGFETIPTIGSIKTGTAASGEFFSFGVSRDDDVSGTIVPFTPPKGQAGGDIIGVKTTVAGTKFNLNSLHAGDGGQNARGGNIQNVTIYGDDAGGYQIIAGNGGKGTAGGAGGSILNFSDFGSQTGKVLIRTGDGGTGTGGAGGAGGNFSFETFNIRGDVEVRLGSGGDGFTNGGNGAGLVKGNFTQPDFSTFTPANSTGTTHLGSTANWRDGAGSYTANIGDNQAVDFDRDGFGDFVYTLRDTSEVVVLFGDGTGGFRTRLNADGGFELDQIHLSGVRNPEALTVADLNGDGFMDIAVGSMDAGSHAGVAVFLSHFEHEGPGTLTGAEDTDGDGQNDFLGFHDVRFSALPQLQTGDPKTTNAVLPYWNSPNQIASIVSGDFNGDGKPELAVVATYYKQHQDINGVIASVGRPDQVLLFMQPDTERDNLTGQLNLTGQFYADFGSKGGQVGNVTLPPAPETPFVFLNGNDLAAESEPSKPNVIVHVSALSGTATHDVVFAGIVGSKDPIQVVDYSLRAGNLPVGLAGFSLGDVDTNREPAEGTNPNRTPVTVTLLDFTIFDYGTNGASDGTADVAAITKAPDLFLVGITGNGNGGGTQSSGNGADQSGNYLGEKSSATSAAYDIADTLYTLQPLDTDADGSLDDLAIAFHGKNGRISHAALFEYKEGPQAAVFQGAFDAQPSQLPAWGEPLTFSVHYADANDLTLPSIAGADSNGSKYFDFTQIVASPTGPLPTLADSVQFGVTGLTIKAGSGGDGVIGNGGNGGNFGGGSSVKTFTQSTTDVNGNTIDIPVTDLVGSLNFTVSGAFRMEAGIGGDGFNNGGHGGDVSGVVVRQRFNTVDGETLVTLTSSAVAGAGGRGVAGHGGDGGSIVGSSIDGARVTLIAGNGGLGDVGGSGGSVKGNGTIVYDALATTLAVTTGNGGSGASRGGNAGDITGFSPIIGLDLGGGAGGFSGNLTYTAGNGGESIAGPGGRGGSILNSSPRGNAFIDGDVVLNLGNGGTGTTGGNGGSIKGFQITLDSSSDNPEFVSVLAGHGGIGISGKGGNGGDIANVNIPSRGLVSFNRLIAGNGGASAAGIGGNGGSVVKASSGSVDGSLAMIAGAGGHGLLAGGNGGSVQQVNLNLGGKSAATKGLVIAGAGGDATAFIPNPLDPTAHQAENAFGGRVGKGGSGGSIIGVAQLGNQEAHADLIAGNGGSTLNYGSIYDSKLFVGNAGSIRNIIMSGNLGNISIDDAFTADVDENVPIKSYNHVLIGETIVRYVEENLRNSLGNLTDNDGNVGVIVGTAGKGKAVELDPVNQPGVYTQIPFAGALNGDFVNATVNNLMAAVAGSVDRIAAIQTVRGLTVISGIVGADKGSFVTPGLDPALPDPVTGEPNKGFGTVGAKTRDYLNADTDTLTSTGTPVRDGALIDGAVVAKKVLNGKGDEITISGRVYSV